MLRRFATSLAATSALVLTATAPALADHADPDVGPLPGNVKTCEGLDLGFEYEVDWEESVENASETITHPWFTAKVSETDSTNLDLDVLVPPSEREPELTLVVLVKGGNATNVFVEPFDDLFAPTNPSGGHADVSNFTVCKVALPDDDDGDDGGNGDDDGDNGDGGEGNGDDKTPEPETTETPVAVPTAVPAGVSGGSDGGSMAPFGIAAAVLAMLAGGAALLRRRFAHQS